MNELNHTPSLQELGAQAKLAAKALAAADTAQKNAALEAISGALLAHQDEILAANAEDVAAAKAGGMSNAMLDRLALTRARLESIANAVLKVRDLPDPVGEELSCTVRPNGLDIRKVRVPMGVIGIIYEARPNVTVDSAVLCLKSGNAAFLRGGKETIRSNMALEHVMRAAIAQAGLPEACVTLLHDTSRETAREMMRLREYIDVLIPRGGAGLIRAVVETASVPVIETGTGNCHIYVDKTAKLDDAVNILFNAKTQRLSTCNTCESLLVHEAVAAEFLPLAADKLAEKNVELRGCEKTCAILPQAKPATEEDYATEFLDSILSIKVVKDVDEAIEHIGKYSTHHSDTIVLYAVYALFFVMCFLNFGSSIEHQLNFGEVHGGWALGGFKYAFYNLGIIPIVLFTTKGFTSRRDSVVAGVLAGIIGIVPGVLLYLSMLGCYPEIMNQALPVNYILELLQAPWLQYAFQIVLFGTLIETGTGYIYAVTDRFSAAFIQRNKAVPCWLTPLITALLLATGVFIAQFGLVDLVNKGYGTITWAFFFIYAVPVVTIGVRKLRRAGRR